MLISNILCISLFSYITFTLPRLHSTGKWGQFIVLLFYSFREIYVTLLSTQQWSFIATVLNKSKSSHMVKYSGLISIASAVGGFLVEHIVKFGGVQCLLYMGLLATVLSWLCDEIAYSMARDQDIAVKTAELLKNIALKEKERESKLISNGSNHHNSHSSADKPKRKRNFWINAAELIFNHDTLRILFFEALIRQFCGNMLNIIFHDGLRQRIPDSSLRAVVVGRFFATVNTIASVLQCFVLPYLLSRESLPQFLMIIPVLVLLSVILSCSNNIVSNALFLNVTLAFGCVKILEYSIMTSATEMIYMPFDCEVRYIGKEFIRFFGHRLGKSFASLLLCTLNAKYIWSFKLQSLIAIIFAILWELIMIRLAQHIIISDKLHAVAVGNSFEESTAFEDEIVPSKYIDKKLLDGKKSFYLSSKPREHTSLTLDPQVLSSRSTSFLPGVFQWSPSNNSLSSMHSPTSRSSISSMNDLNTYVLEGSSAHEESKEEGKFEITYQALDSNVSSLGGCLENSYNQYDNYVSINSSKSDSGLNDVGLYLQSKDTFDNEDISFDTEVNSQNENFVDCDGEHWCDSPPIIVPMKFVSSINKYNVNDNREPEYLSTDINCFETNTNTNDSTIDKVGQDIVTNLTDKLSNQSINSSDDIHSDNDITATVHHSKVSLYDNEILNSTGIRRRKLLHPTYNNISVGDLKHGSITEVTTGMISTNSTQSVYENGSSVTSETPSKCEVTNSPVSPGAFDAADSFVRRRQ